MNPYPLLIVAGLLIGCSGVPGLPPPATTNHFAYTIDPVIAGRYGAGEAVAWGATGEGRRPTIMLLGPQRVEFQPYATEADLQRFQEAFQASIAKREILPATPDGSIPAKATNAYLMTFGTEGLSLDGLDALAEATGYRGSLVFSSEHAAKVFYQMLRAKDEAAAYKVRVIGFNALFCVPEDCGPDDGPVPSYPPVEPRSTP